MCPSLVALARVLVDAVLDAGGLQHTVLALDRGAQGRRLRRLLLRPLFARRGNERRELVAANPLEQVLPAEMPAQDARELPNDPVAEDVAEMVVGLLEVVDAKDEEGVQAAGLFRRQVLNPPLGGRLVEQAGHLVGLRERLHPGLLLLFRDDAQRLAIGRPMRRALALEVPLGGLVGRAVVGNDLLVDIFLDERRGPHDKTTGSTDRLQERGLFCGQLRAVVRGYLADLRRGRARQDLFPTAVCQGERRYPHKATGLRQVYQGRM